MPTALQNSKLTKRFQLLDLNGDGYIAEDDYTQMITRLLESTGQHRGAELGRAIEERLLHWWWRLREAMDVDGDGRVSFEEYIHAVDSAVLQQDEAFRKHGRPAMEALAAAADRDGDGYLTVGEYVGLLTAWRVPSAEAEWVFHALDADGDGQLSREEFHRAAEEFFTGDNASAVSNEFWGAL